MCDCMNFSQRDAEFSFEIIENPPFQYEVFINAERYLESQMNSVDNSRQQYQMYGNQVQLSCARKLDFDALTQTSDRPIVRHLIAEMSKSGNYIEAMDMLCETIEKMEVRIKELEEK